MWSFTGNKGSFLGGTIASEIVTHFQIPIFMAKAD